MTSMLEQAGLRSGPAPHPLHPDASELAGLWGRYEHDGEPLAREELVLAYAPLVEYIAERMATRLPRHIEVGDLVSYGMEGLISAIGHFAPDRNIRFETYAFSRIRGAMIDELRAMDWVPRSVRKRSRALDAASGKLRDRFQRAPSECEMAAELGIGLDVLNGWRADSSCTTVGALDEPQTGNDPNGADLSLVDVLEDPGSGDPADIMQASESKKGMVAAISLLPERERLVISLYYFEGLTMREIGKLRGVSESRISQLHAKAVLDLRAQLPNDEDALDLSACSPG